MKTFLFILFITLTAFVNSCSKSGIELKEGTLNLALKKCADGKVSGDKLSFCFDSLVSDSRCPANAVCIWQGAATASFSFTKNGDTHCFDLSTITMKPNYTKDTVIAGYKIEFINLSPYPGTIDPLPDNQRKAELKITKQ